MIIETAQHYLRTRRASVGIVAGVIIAVCLVSMLWTTGVVSSQPETRLYYVNEVTQAESIRNALDVPPMPDDSGKPNLVQASFFTCSTPDQKWAGYYNKIDDAAVEAVRKALAGLDLSQTAFMPSIYKKNLLIRLPAPGSPWVQADSPQGQAILKQLRCPHDPQHAFFLTLPEKR